METQNKVVCIPTDKKQQLIDLTDMLNETVLAPASATASPESIPSTPRLRFSSASARPR